MTTRERVTDAVVQAVALTALTTCLLLGGHGAAANWMKGPYYPLALLLPRSVDGLPPMAAVVLVYCLAVLLVALRRRTWRAALPVVAIVVAVNTIASLMWRLQ